MKLFLLPDAAVSWAFVGPVVGLVSVVCPCELLLLAAEYVAVGVGVKHVLIFWNDTDIFTAKINLTYRYIFSPYRAVNTPLFCYKNQSVKAV